MPAPLVPLVIKALFGGLGLLAAGLGIYTKTPKEAVREVRLKHTLRGAKTTTRALPSVIVVPTDPNQVAGSGDLGAINAAAPDAALKDIGRLDSRWAPAVESYRALHDGYPTQASIAAGQGKIVRYPTRWAILRATVDALTHSDPFAAKYGEAYALTDPTTNELRPEWLEVVSLYDPTPEELAAMAAEVEQFYEDAAAPDPGVFDYLRTLLDTTTSALAMDWKGALRGGVKLAGLGENSSGGGATSAPRQIAREEEAILSYLLSWARPVQVEVLSGGRRVVLQTPRTAWEALSGGGTPLDRGWASLGGVKEIASRIRAVPGVTDATKALPDASIALKAALLARRVPAVGSFFALPYTAVPKPAASGGGSPTDIRNQNPGGGGSPTDPNVNSQYTGPQQ